MNWNATGKGEGRGARRNRILVTLLLGAALGAGNSSAADAGDSGAKQGQAGQAGVEKALPAPYRLSSWIGKTVSTGDGKKLGEVQELVMDDAAIVRYVIVKRATEWDPEQSLVAVPLGHFSYRPGKSPELSLDISAAHMRSAPAFAASGWPNMGDPAWTTMVFTFWRAPEAAMQAGREQAGQQQAGTEQAVSYAPNRDMIYLSQEQEQLFDRLDEDKDGAIQRDEAQRNDRLANRFDELDSYVNDQLTRSEFSMFEPVGEGD
jgi:hypothetical protein